MSRVLSPHMTVQKIRYSLNSLPQCGYKHLPIDQIGIKFTTRANDYMQIESFQYLRTYKNINFTQHALTLNDFSND